MEEVTRPAFALATRRCVIVVTNINRCRLRISDADMRMRPLGMPVSRMLECVYRTCQCKLERQHAKQQKKNESTHDDA